MLKLNGSPPPAHMLTRAEKISRLQSIILERRQLIFNLCTYLRLRQSILQPSEIEVLDAVDNGQIDGFFLCGKGASEREKYEIFLEHARDACAVENFFYKAKNRVERELAR